MPTPLHRVKAEFFKTLGHPARIRILEVLTQGEHSVGEIQREVGLEASHLSQQLGVLRRAGVIVSRKEGTSVYYSLASADFAELMMVARKILTRMLSGSADVLKDLRAEDRTARRRAG